MTVDQVFAQASLFYSGGTGAFQTYYKTQFTARLAKLLQVSVTDFLAIATFPQYNQAVLTPTIAANAITFTSNDADPKNITNVIASITVSAVTYSAKVTVASDLGKFLQQTTGPYGVDPNLASTAALKYLVVTADTAANLQIAVNAHILIGYQTFGTPVVTQDAYSALQWAQPMTLTT